MIKDPPELNTSKPLFPLFLWLIMLHVNWYKHSAQLFLSKTDINLLTKRKKVVVLLLSNPYAGGVSLHNINIVYELNMIGNTVSILTKKMIICCMDIRTVFSKKVFACKCPVTRYCISLLPLLWAQLSCKTCRFCNLFSWYFSYTSWVIWTSFCLWCISMLIQLIFYPKCPLSSPSN